MIEIKKPVIECLEQNEERSYGKFVIEPLERGYGISLRPLSLFAAHIYPDENPL